ncbi:MAG: hypothetical protein K6C12_15670 [Oscillospiraceae bacterium]|nr:hypothetical protein [Oscillospiraceae bacterium]
MSGRIGTFHRWMALLLCVVMCMSLFPMTVFADEGEDAAAEVDVFAGSDMSDEAEPALYDEPEALDEEEPEEPVGDPADMAEAPEETEMGAPAEAPAEEPPAEEPAEELPSEEPSEEPSEPETEPADEPEEEEIIEDEEGDEFSDDAADAANYLNTIQVTDIVKDGNYLKVVWDPEPEVRYYAIWRQAGNETAWTRVKIVSIGATAVEASYKDPKTAADNGKVFAYYVQSAKNASGTNSEPTTDPNTGISGPGALAAPVAQVTPADSVAVNGMYAAVPYYLYKTPVQNKPKVVDNGIELSWSNVSINTASTYVVERATDPAGPYNRINVNQLTATKYVDESALSGQQYWYIVRVMNKAGTDYQCEDPMNPALNINPRFTTETFYTKAAVIPTAQKGLENLYASVTYTAPDGTVTANPYANYIRIRWKATQDAAGGPGAILQNYRIERMDDVVTGQWKDLGALTVGVTCGVDLTYDPTGNTLYYDDFDIANQRLYTYRVKNLAPDMETVLGSFDKDGQDIAYFMTPYLNTGDPTENYEVADNGITLYWTRVPGVSVYRIYRTENLPPVGAWRYLTDKSSKVVVVKATEGQTQMMYTDERVAAGRTYFYTVVCRDNGDSWDISPYNDLGIQATFTEMPILKSAVTQALGIDIEWQLVRGVDDYAIFRRAAGSEKWVEFDRVNVPYVAANPPATNVTAGSPYTDVYPASHHGIRFYYTVRCLNGAGEYISSYSKTGVSATWYAPPVIINDPAKSVAGGIKLEWQESEGAYLYGVYRRTDPAALWELIALSDSEDGCVYYDVSLVKGVETLSVNSNYYYAVGVLEQVAATGNLDVDYELCSDLAAPGAFTANPARYYPVPELVSLEGDPDGLKLTWKLVGDAVTAADYRIYRKEIAAAEFKEVFPNPNVGGAPIVIDPATATASWVDMSVQSGNRYWYTVAVYDGTLTPPEDRSGYDPVGLSKLFFGVAGFDGIVKLEATEKGLTLTFKVVDGVPLYQVMRSESSGALINIGDPIPYNKANGDGHIVFTDTTAVSGGQYNYTVMLIGPENEELGLMKTFPDPTGADPRYPLGYFTYFQTPGLKTARIGELVDTTLHATIPDPNKYGYTEFIWEDTDGALTYNIYRKLATEKEWSDVPYVIDYDPSAFGPKWSYENPGFEDTNVVPNVQYVYTVAVSDGSGFGIDISGKNLTGVKTTFLNAPVVINTPDSSDVGGIMVHWRAVQGCKGYEILRKLEGATSFETIARVNGYTKQNYLDKKAVPGVRYIYTVRAFNGNLKSGYLYLDGQTTSGMFFSAPILKSVAPWGNEPTPLSGMMGGPGILITWKDLMNGGFDIDIEEKDDTLVNYAWDDPKATIVTNTITATGAGDYDFLIAKTYSVNPQKYSYRMRINDSGFTSAWSAVQTVTFYPPVQFATVNPIVSVKDGNQIYWQKMTGISKYKVYRDLGDGRGFLPLATTTGFTYTDKATARNAISGMLATYAVVGMIGTKEVTPLDSTGAPYTASNVYVGLTTLVSAAVMEKDTVTSANIRFKLPATSALGVEPDGFNIYVKNLTMKEKTWKLLTGPVAAVPTEKAGVYEVNTGDLSAEILTDTKYQLSFCVQAVITTANPDNPDGNEHVGPNPLDAAIGKSITGRNVFVYNTPAAAVLTDVSARLDKQYNDGVNDLLTGVMGIKCTVNNRGIYTNTLYFEPFSGATRFVIYKYDRHGAVGDPESWTAVGYATVVNDPGLGVKVARYIDRQGAKNAVYPDDQYAVCAANGSAAAGGWVSLYP